MSTFANSEDPDERQHNAAFHQCLVKKIFREKKYNIFFLIYNLTPLDMPSLLYQTRRNSSLVCKVLKHNF